ncbi:hypothetical protein GF336_01770 [Candidatus Woesearchaeota archaeon]|nr:hypothetical protein [Candidatus Woesearchaeota archaeon]
MEKRGFSLDKKGQIAIFIIVGILILVSAVSVIYIRSIVTKEKIAPELPRIARVADEVEPIQDYVEFCINDIGEQGLKKLGKQGGYLDLEENGISANPVEPTEGKAIVFPPDLMIPYWWYLESSNECGKEFPCTFGSERPELEGQISIQSQLQDYVSGELRACLDDFAPFVEQGFTVEEAGDITTIVTFTQTDTIIYVDYPLEVEKEGKHTINQFYTRIPVNMKKMYSLATDIVNSQKEFCFLERRTMMSLNPFTGVDKDKLPPISEMTFEPGGGVMWERQKVKEKIESIITPYIQGMTVYDTLNYERVIADNQVTQGFYDDSVLPLNLEGTYSDLAVTFDYLSWWPLYFGSPSIIKPESAGNPIIPFIGVQRYNNPYDISFPTLINIKDPEALNGEGYSLKFALEANIRNNKCLNATGEDLQGVSLPERSLFNNRETWSSPNITINVVDKEDEPIPEVGVSFICTDKAFIGKTDEEGKLTSKFPKCAPEGKLSLIEYDYFSPIVKLNTLIEEETELPEIKMWPYKEVEVSVDKWAYDPSTGQISSNPLSLGFDEEAIITIEKVKQDAYEQDVVGFAEYALNNTNATMTRLVPGDYEVEIVLYSHDEIIIQPDRRCEGGGFWGGEECYYVPEEPLVLDEFVMGGAVLDQSTGYFTITPEDLYSGKDLKLYIITTEPLIKLEHLTTAGDKQAMSSRFRQYIEPRFEE